MSLIELLPLLRGWEYDLEEITFPLPLRPGQEGGKMEIPYPGWLCWCMVKMNHPNAIAILRYHYIGKTYEATTTPSNLYDMGLTLPNPSGFWCPRYDTSEDVYAIAYTPNIYTPFRYKCVVSLKAPPTAPVTGLYFGLLGIRIFDMEDFKLSLKEVLGTEGIIETIPLLGGPGGKRG